MWWMVALAWAADSAATVRPEAVLVEDDVFPSCTQPKDDGRWKKNQRVTKLGIRFLEAPEPNASREQWIYTATEGLVAELPSSPTVASWTVDFGAHWHQNMEQTEVVGIELTVLAVEGAGASYEDTCISEVAWLDAGDAAGPRTCDPRWCETQPTPLPGCPGG